jgi:hypothetical protein
MKNIKILSMIFLFGGTAVMHGMTTLRTGARRMQTASKPLIQQPIQPMPTQPTLIPSAQPEIKKTSPFLDQKKLLSGVTLAAAKLKISQAGQYVRNWFNNLMTSWFNASPFAKASKDAMADMQTVTKPIMVAPVENTPSPFVTGIQKRQYSAVAERQPVTVAEEKAPEKQLSPQEESAAIIKQLQASRGTIDAQLIERIRVFFKKNSVDDVQNLFVALVRWYGYEFDQSLFVDEHDQATALKIEDVKQKILKGMGSDVGLKNDKGQYFSALLPANVDSFIASVKTIVNNISGS